MSVGDVLVLVLAVLLMVGAGLILRGRTMTWAAIMLAAVASGVCFTLGGDASPKDTGPSLNTLMGALGGFTAVVSAIFLLTQGFGRSETPSRLPILVCCAITVVAAVVLAVTALLS